MRFVHACVGVTVSECITYVVSVVYEHDRPPLCRCCCCCRFAAVFLINMSAVICILWNRE